MIYWNSASDFWAMGGYGFYVWGSFGVTALVMALEPMLTLRQRSNTLLRLKRQLRADQRASQENQHATPALSEPQVSP